tara:strand:- start:136 stop:636 length:501 start_codon:yes stop_codon:yes gene_type:complete
MMSNVSQMGKSYCRRAFTLIEVVIGVMILGIAVPPTLNLMETAASGRVDAISTTRATFLATVVLETVFADMTSTQETLGFDALEDPNTYLETASTGLYDRLASATEPFTRVGLEFEVSIGSFVSSDGSVSDNESENVFRVITVNVTVNSASQAAVIMPVSMMVSEM